MAQSHYLLPSMLIVGVALGAGGTTLLNLQQAPASTAALPPTATPAPRTAALDAKEQGRAPAERPALTRSTQAAGAESEGTRVLLRYPPPHVTNTAFYGPTIDQEEAEQLREDALDELVTSMRTAGLPETDIEVMAAQAAQTPAEVQPPPVDDPDLIAPTIADQTEELVLSMRAAGRPEVELDGIEQNLLQAEEARLASEAAAEAPPDHERGRR